MSLYHVSLVYRPPGDPDPVTGDLPPLEDDTTEVEADTPREAARAALGVCSVPNIEFAVVVLVHTEPVDRDEWWFMVDEISNPLP